MAIESSELAYEIALALESFQGELMDEVKKSVKKEAQSCVKELKETSPKLTGDYAEGWRSQVAFESSTDIRMRIYNSGEYYLTHLLEDGHETVGGGRAPAYPHIAPAAEKSSKRLLTDISVKVGKV